MESILVPIFICVVLPVSIILILSLTKINGENKRCQVIIKAIEANKDVDTEKLIESLKKPVRSAAEILNGRLLKGCIYSLIGLTLAITGIINLLSGSESTTESISLILIVSGLSFSFGISYLIVYFLSKKQVNSPVE